MLPLMMFRYEMKWHASVVIKCFEALFDGRVCWKNYSPPPPPPLHWLKRAKASSKILWFLVPMAYSHIFCKICGYISKYEKNMIFFHNYTHCLKCFTKLFLKIFFYKSIYIALVFPDFYCSSHFLTDTPNYILEIYCLNRRDV